MRDYEFQMKLNDAISECLDVKGVLPHYILNKLIPIINAQLAASQQETRDALAALAEVMSWIDNWEIDFMGDDEWPKTEAKARAALAALRTGEREG